MSSPSENTSVARARWFSFVAYLVLLAGGAGAFFVIRAFGEGLSAPTAPPDARSVGRPLQGQVDVIFHVIATLAAVILLGFVLGRLFRFIGQPPVIGEVVAGIMLGPSLLGAVWPDAMHLLIPPPDIDLKGQVPAALRAVAQL